MLSVLPSGVTTFAACPVPVAVAGDRGSGSGRGGDATTVVAAVTDAGGLEVATVRRGTLSPLSAQLTLSLGAPFSPLLPAVQAVAAAVPEGMGLHYTPVAM